MFRFLTLFFLLLLGSCGGLQLQQHVDVHNNALQPLPKIENDFYDWYKRHDLIKQSMDQQKPELVFIGDSITHMFGGEPRAKYARGKQIWQENFGQWKTVNMGFGWDRTQNVLWRLQHGEFEGISPKVVVLMIGTNNFTGTKNARASTAPEVAAAIENICAEILQRSPQSQIILCSVLPWLAKNNKQRNEKILVVNGLIAPLAAHKKIHYLDLHQHFAEADDSAKPELMNDGVHPSSAGYKTWAKEMMPLLQGLMGDK